MNSLKVPLSDITEEGIQIDVTTEADAIRPEGAETLGLGPIRVEGTLSGEDGLYIFQGRIAGLIEGPCDRCLKQVEWPFAIRVQWTFMEHEPGIDEDVYEGGVEDTNGYVRSTASYTGDELDMTRQTWDELALAMPSKFPPLDESKTHCLACGEAVSSLAHQEEDQEHTMNKGLAGLKDMFPDLPPKKE